MKLPELPSARQAFIVLNPARLMGSLLLPWVAACGASDVGAPADTPPRVVVLEFRSPHPQQITWIARTVNEHPYRVLVAQADLDLDGSADTVVVGVDSHCSTEGCATWVFLSGGATLDLGGTHLLDGETATVEYAADPSEPARLVSRDAAGSAYVPDRGPRAGQPASYAIAVPPPATHAIVDVRFRDALPAEVARIAAVVDPGTKRLRIAELDLDGDRSPDQVVVDASRRCGAAGCPTWVHFSSGLVTELGETWLLEGETMRVVFGTVPHAPPMLAPRRSDGKPYVPEGRGEDDLVYYPVLPIGDMPTRIVARGGRAAAPE